MALPPALRELIREAHSQGNLDEMICQAIRGPEDSDFELIPGGMTDASKRRMTSPPVADAELTGTDDVKTVTAHPASFGLKIPVGVKDLDEWGQTVLSTGKYSKSGLSYKELFVSKEKDHASYVTWMLNQRYRMDLTAPVKDFVRYLTVMKQHEGVANAECFEGSSIRRELKSK